MPEHRCIYGTIGNHAQRITAVELDTLYFLRYVNTNAYLRHVAGGHTYETQAGPDGAALFSQVRAAALIKAINFNNDDKIEMIPVKDIVKKGYTKDANENY